MNKAIKIMLVIALALGLVMTGCTSTTTSTTTSTHGNQTGDLAPDFQLQDLDGQTVTLSDLRGSTVLINFWATWCGPCRSEMPYLQVVYEKWTDRGLVVLTINDGESHSQVEEFMESQNLSLPVLLDTDQEVAQSYGIQYVPTTFFIDKDGIIQERIVGAFPNTAAIEETLGTIMP